MHSNGPPRSPSFHHGARKTLAATRLCERARVREERRLHFVGDKTEIVQARAVESLCAGAGEDELQCGVVVRVLKLCEGAREQINVLRRVASAEIEDERH